MSSDESTGDQFDHTDLPPTIPYDFLDIPSSPTHNLTASSTTNAAPHHSESASHSNSTSLEHYSSESHSGSFHSSSSYGRLDGSLDSWEGRDIVSEANRRLFRSQSGTMEVDSGRKRKHGFEKTEETVAKRNLERGYSDLTNIASNRSKFPGYSDVPTVRGQIDPKQRRYLEKNINMAGLTASLDSSNISSGETLMDLATQHGSFSSASVSIMEQHHDSSFNNSDHSLQSNPTYSSYSGPESQFSTDQKDTSSELVIATTESSTKSDTTAPNPPSATSSSNMYHVESSCPIDDLAYRQELNSSQHLENYSPERSDEFAREVSLQQSSTPIRPIIGSTFPEEDLVNLQLSIPKYPLHDDNNPDQDSSPPSNQRIKALSLQNLDKIPSLFLDLQQNQTEVSQASSNRPNMLPTTSDQTPRSAQPTLRRLRSNSDLPVAARNTSKYYVMFASSIDSQKYHRAILAMGATMVNNWDQCTHWVSDNIRKTANLLCALASKKWIVSERWVEQSIANARFEDENDYVLIRQSAPNYFINKKLFFCPSVKIKRSDAQDLAKAAGAKLRVKEPNMEVTDPSVVVIFSGKPKEVRAYQDVGYETMERENFLEVYGRSDG